MTKSALGTLQPIRLVFKLISDALQPPDPVEWALLPQKVLVGAGEVTEPAGAGVGRSEGPLFRRVRVCMDPCGHTERQLG